MTPSVRSLWHSIQNQGGISHRFVALRNGEEMNYLKKNFPVFLLSGSLIFAGISFSPNAQAATATIGSLTKSVNSLSAKVKLIEAKLSRYKICQNTYANSDSEVWNSYVRDYDGDFFMCLSLDK
jgi:hypothetical protein